MSKKSNCRFWRTVGICFILLTSAIFHTSAQSDDSDGDGGSSGGSSSGPVDTGGSGDSGGSDDTGDQDGDGPSAGQNDDPSSQNQGDSDSGSDQDNGSNVEVDRNPHNVSIDIFRKLDGTIVFTLVPGSLPQGNYEFRSEGDLIFEFSLSEFQEGVDRRLIYAGNPRVGFELPLDFDILGKNIAVVTGETIYFSDFVTQFPRSRNVVEIGFKQETGSTVLIKPLDLYDLAFSGSEASLRIDRMIDGNYEFQCDFRSGNLGEFTLVIGGELRGVFVFSQANKGSLLTLRFAENPSSVGDSILDFELVGQEVLIQKNEQIIFAGVINFPVEVPKALSHIGMGPEIQRDIIAFDEIESIQYPEILNVDGLGYFKPTSFPFMYHCLLGLVEYRYTQGRNFLVSMELGALEIMKNDQSDLLYSYKTGDYYLLSETMEDCTLLVPGAFFNIETDRYHSTVLPTLEDVQAYYDIAFKATQLTQLRSSETIALVQVGDMNGAFVRLTDAVTYRNQAIALAHQVIHSSSAVGDAVDFWKEAGLHLMNTVDAALIEAQKIYAAGE